MAKQKYYAVAKGRSTGVFDSWEGCQESIKGFSGATYKSFASQELAEQYLIGQGVFTIGHHSTLFPDVEKNKKVRLIDADKLIAFIRDEYHGGYSEIQLAPYEVINMIEEQPIAYDAQKVINQLEEASYNADMCDTVTDGECMEEWNDTVVPLDKAIEIVKAGGME